MWNLEKMVQMNRFAGQKLRHRCREQTYGHQGGKAPVGGSGGVMNWEIGIDMYTLKKKKKPDKSFFPVTWLIKFVY